jgi:adenylate cyclase
VQYDPRRRPWYRAATATGPVSVGPYVTATTNSLALTVAVPMVKDKAIVVGVDVMLETISRLLAREAISAHSRGYVFGAENKLIVHSDKQMMDQILNSYSTAPRGGVSGAVTDPALESVKGHIRATAGSQNPTVRFQADGEPYLAHISSVGFSDLLRGNTVAIAAPLADFTGPSTRLLTKNLIIAGTMLIAGIMVALLVARLIGRALIALAEEARQIGNLEFNQNTRETSWIAEINTLAAALATAREAIRTFALYVPRELVRRIVTAGQATAGKAVRQDVTVLFTDIRDFTTISEQHSPEEVAGMLSDYFQLMNEIVERHNGVIIQYLGDSIYAMWNAPEADPTHVEDACLCALELKAAIDDLNAAKRTAGRPELVTRFGVHTGVAVVGSVGAEVRRQYTGMGDTVNVASRLEGMNKQFGTTILVSNAVRERGGSRFQFRNLGAAHAKGRSEEIEVFELVGVTRTDLPPQGGTA